MELEATKRNRPSPSRLTSQQTWWRRDAYDPVASRAAFEASRIHISVVQRTHRAVKGFIILPKRWIVERTFGWLNRSRRLAKNFETLIESSLAWFMLALTALLVQRSARDYQQMA